MPAWWCFFPLTLHKGLIGYNRLRRSLRSAWSIIQGHFASRPTIFMASTLSSLRSELFSSSSNLDSCTHHSSYFIYIDLWFIDGWMGEWIDGRGVVVHGCESIDKSTLSRDFLIYIFCSVWLLHSDDLKAWVQHNSWLGVGREFSHSMSRAARSWIQASIACYFESVWLSHEPKTNFPSLKSPMSARQAHFACPIIYLMQALSFLTWD